VRLVIRVVPLKGHKPPPGTESFLTYVQRFDIAPQINPSFSTTGSAGQFPEPSSSMYLLKRSTRADGSRLGDVVPLGQLRVLMDLIPHFGAKADTRLTKENSMEFSTEFWLNKYFEKEVFYGF
jgi:hypothetical protein